MYSQCFLPTINDKDGQVGPSARLAGRLFFIMGIIKDPECLVNELCTMHMRVKRQCKKRCNDSYRTETKICSL